MVMTATTFLAWISIVGFVIASLFEFTDRTHTARRVGVVSWICFGVFWVAMTPYYLFEAASPIQSVLAVFALPLCLHAAYRLYEGRDSVLLLTKAVAVMGVIYLPAEMIPFVRQWLIEVTARQVHWGLELFGYSPGINEGANGYQSRFNFDPDETVTGRTTYIVLACTGIGSMAMFTGLIAAVNANWKQKLTGIAVVVGLIWILNLARNVFITIASPYGWFQYDSLIYITTNLMGSHPAQTSYLVAHNFIAQTLSVVALIALAVIVARIVPEVSTLLEEVVYICTTKTVDLSDVVGLVQK